MIRTYKRESKQITEHFNILEFACKDGSDVIILDDAVIKKLELIRLEIKRPIIINSGYRTNTYNKSINGASNSYHCKGQAVDIKASGLSAVELGLYCARYFNGIIIHKDFVHCDVREKRYIYTNF